ncbi:hypothetical protein ASG72_01355 [Bosea sp. Leaf344]|uniref:DUF2177 family protein n=1 Tax=Bosea sp. Leaf344 TaxID=1736346 RepID=UPI0007002496|nr:DUF2177 family protein [Bosea sp. Leaf344]KQU54326.1 hypothetical protein ASG72_01355 [Bosea sp. Leaf344]
MTRFLLIYAATALILFPLDLLWLKYVAREFYVARMGDLLLPEPRLGIAALFYLVYVAGIAWFAILPNLASGSVLAALLAGAGLGVLAYGTYDITNLSTLRGFPVSVALTDLAWGTVLTAVSAAGGLYIATRWFGVAAE